MEKTKEKQQKTGLEAFSRNVLIIMIAQVLVKILGLIYRIVILNIDGFTDEANGFYSTGYEVYAILLTISSIGLPGVISKLVAEKRAIGDNKGANKIFKTAFYLFSSIGLIISVLLYVFADQIAIKTYNVENIKYILKVLAPSIVFVSMASILRGYFAGIGDMKPSSISQILEQILNCTLTILFVILAIGQNSYFMAAAANISTTIAVISAFIYLAIYYNKHKLKIDENEKSNLETKSIFYILKIILSFSIPITIGSLISVINGAIDTITISQVYSKIYVNNFETQELLEKYIMSQNGIISKVTTLLSLPQALNIAFVTVIIPTVSAYFAKNDIQKVKKTINNSLKSSLMIILPAYIGLFVLAEPILQLLFPKASSGALFMQLQVFTFIFVTITHTLTSAINGLGDVIKPTIITFCITISKYFLNKYLITIPNLNIYGVAIASIVIYFISMIVNFIILNKKIKVEIEYKEIVKILILSIFTGIIAYLMYNITHIKLNNLLSSCIAIISAVLVYVYGILKLKLVEEELLEKIPFWDKLKKYIN